MQQQSPASFPDKPVRQLPQVRLTAYLLMVVGILELIYGQWMAPVGRLQINCMTLVIGLALYFGGSKVVATIRWLALFAVLPTLLMPIQQALLVPVDLTLAQLRLYPGRSLAYYLPMLFMGMVALVVTLRLKSQPVKAVLGQSGNGRSSTWLPLLLGLLLITMTTLFLRHTLGGPAAMKAAHIAANQFGPKYQYFTNRLNLANNHGITVYATVQMWNETEVLEVPVRWQE